ncbi:MAG: PAS domain S-box protein [Lacunisphaera sp.]|nr:PAS domain S-box protein [Lacunisphaera sp.]
MNAPPNPPAEATALTVKPGAGPPYAAIVEFPGDAVIGKTPEGVITSWSPSAEKLFGYTAAEAVGQHVQILIPPDWVHEERHILARVAQGEGVNEYETVRRRKDGSTIHVGVRLAAVKDGHGQIVGVTKIARDITARKQVEESLRASEERFRQVVESIREVFWIIDLTRDRVIYVSPSYDEIWGESPAKLYASPNHFADSIYPGDRQRYDEAVREKQLDGRFDESFRIVRPDGTLRWIHSKAYPVRNVAGAIYRIVGVADDITDRKQLEEISLRAQRLESIGLLAAGISHDLNNVLAPISMAVSLLRHKLSESGDLRLLDILEKSGERGAGLVRQILGFVHGIGGEARLVQVKHLLHDIAGIITQTFPKSIALHEKVPNDLWPVLANPTQIHQVLLNLCVNARDAMPSGGTLTLCAENCVLDAVAARAIEGAAPGAWLMLQVADTGTGISPGVLARVWEPFFTTKAAGLGTGLGLSTVRGIVATYQGFTTLQTAPGRGTIVSVYLPADLKSLAASDSTHPHPVAHGRSELILLVDDEKSIRDIAEAILVKFGYRVVTAADGAEALEIFEVQGTEIALIITDLDMPLLNGSTLAGLLRASRPALKILAMSGIASLYTRAKPCEFATAFMSKPFTVEILLKNVRELLHGPDAPVLA